MGLLAREQNYPIPETSLDINEKMHGIIALALLNFNTAYCNGGCCDRADTTLTETADAVTVTTCVRNGAAKRHVGTTVKSSTTSSVKSANTLLLLPLICLRRPRSRSLQPLPPFTAQAPPLTSLALTSWLNSLVIRPPFDVNSDGVYSRFDPTYFKSLSPKVSGIAGPAGGSGGSCPHSSSTFTFYGLYWNCQNIALHYRGYLYAGQTNTFTFSIIAADDIILVWAGQTAYSSWTRANALLDVTYPELGAGPGGSITRTQGDGPFGFGVQITAPGGTTVLSTSISSSEYLVHKSCDGTAARCLRSASKDSEKSRDGD
ncbi:hypothetical protein SCUP515_11254 [Seiridium cupressi]